MNFRSNRLHAVTEFIKVLQSHFFVHKAATTVENVFIVQRNV